MPLSKIHNTLTSDHILLDATDSTGANANSNVLLDSSAANTDVGSLMSYEAGAVDAAITLPVGRDDLSLAGGIVQIVQTTKTDTFEVTGTSFTDVPGMSVAITPASTSNKILILLNVHYGNGADAGAAIKLLRGSTEIFIGDAASSRPRVTIGGLDLTDTNNAIYSMDSSSACFLDSPSTTDSTLYKIQLRGRDSFGSGFLNRTSNDADDSTSGIRAVSSITVMEVQA